MASKPKQESESRKKFRADFYSRLSDSNLSVVSKGTGIAQDTLYSWQNPNKGLPDIDEAERIANIKKVAASWLAFGRGPRDETTARQQEALGKLLESNPELFPILESYVNAHPEDKAILSAMSKRIAPPKDAKIIPVEARPRRRNTRDQFPTLTVVASKPRPKAKPLPQYLGLAAGSARVLEQCHDLVYVREWRGELHSGTVLGDSMLNTVISGDRIALQPYNGGEGVTLPRLAGDEPNPIQIIKQQVPEDSICILSRGDEPDEVTLKRVNYQTHSDGSWYMKITADNPDAIVFGHKGSYTVKGSDEIFFWARMVGFIGGGQ